MKKTTLNIILMTILTLPCLGQDKGQSEITASYAVMPRENPLSTLWLGLSGFDALANGNFTLRQGAVFASYKYFVSDRIAVGATAGFNGNVREGLFWFKDFTKVDARVTSIAGEMTWFFVKKSKLKLYAMTGLGLYVMRSSVDNFSTSTRNYGPTTQLTPIAVKFGKELVVFAEMGYGYKGIVNTGLSIDF
jgi:hypothetical protein